MLVNGSRPRADSYSREEVRNVLVERARAARAVAAELRRHAEERRSLRVQARADLLRPPADPW